MYKDKNYIVTFSGQNSPGLTYKFTHDKTKDYQETKAKGRQF
jgi:hypothetical protein